MDDFTGLEFKFIILYVFSAILLGWIIWEIGKVIIYAIRFKGKKKTKK